MLNPDFSFPDIRNPNVEVTRKKHSGTSCTPEGEVNT
jgi:hypothetical protein